MQNRHSLPANRVIVYLHSLSAPDVLPACLPDLTAINLSFFHFGFRHGLPQICLNDLEPDHPAYDDTWARMKQAQRAGVKVCATLGGPRAAYAALFDDYDTFYPLWRDVLRDFHLDGADLAVEESVAQDDIERLIADLRRDFPPDFLVTAAPVARALWHGYDPLSQLVWLPLAASLDWFNVQFHGGYGSLATSRDYDAIIEAGHDPAQIVAGVLSNPADGSGYVPLAQLCGTLRALAARYDGQAGGVAGWGYAGARNLAEQIDPAGWSGAVREAVAGAQFQRRRA
jgi:hypothetical protein